MIRIIITIFIIFPLGVKSQEAASLSFEIKNCAAKNVEIIAGSYNKPENLFQFVNLIKIPLNHGKAKWTNVLTKPAQITFYLEDTISNNYSSFVLFLSPGDNLVILVDQSAPESNYSIKGKGSENNQPLLQKLINNELNLEAYYSDSLPEKLMSAIVQRNYTNIKTLSEYISKYKPTLEFINFHNLYFQYYPLWTYLIFKGSHQFKIRKSYFRNESYWQAIEDSLVLSNNLNNIDALEINEFSEFISIYLTRIKEKLWNHPELLNTYYDTEIQEDAVKLLNEDPENLLKEKIINKHFSGKTAEFLFAVLFQNAMNQKEDNLPEIFTRFSEAYPQSPYLPYIEPTILKIIERKKQKLTAEMIFVDNNDSLKSWENLLSLVEGKTVLVDMWGTWCGPCRSEISLNSDFIKNYYKNSDLQFLYIANFDSGKEKKWKELIAYYNLIGTHILANKELTKEIMTKINGTGYPTYFIIKKDRSFELSEAGFPMNREMLYKQIDRILKEK